MGRSPTEGVLWKMRALFFQKLLSKHRRRICLFAYLPTPNTPIHKTHLFLKAHPDYTRWVIPRLAWSEQSTGLLVRNSTCLTPPPETDLISPQKSPKITHSPGEQANLGNKVIGDSLQLQMSLLLLLIMPQLFNLPLPDSSKHPKAGLSPDDSLLWHAFAEKHLRKIRNVTFGPWW